MERVLTNASDENGEYASNSKHSDFDSDNVSTNKAVCKSQSFTSVQTGYSRSSSYQLHFDVDDDLLKPDDNFVTDDWDE